ncbi:hypothetical protein DL765_005581 [Monosporascus sp. GIB2]|nr:hypothetical protein DL765_005581 [Monosporascus sp. GIB2]
MLSSSSKDFVLAVRLAPPPLRGDPDFATMVKSAGKLVSNANLIGHFMRQALIQILLLLLAYLAGPFAYRYFFHPLAGLPGPRLAPFSNICAVVLGTAQRQGALGPVVRMGVNHLSFSTHAAQKIIYGFGTKEVPSFAKNPEFSTPEVDGTLNIIVEIDKKEHARMRHIG